MRTFVTVFLILTLLVLLISAEQIYISNFCNDFLHDIDTLQKTQGSEAIDITDKMIDKWNCKKDILFIFANHNSFEKIEEKIHNIKYFLKNKNDSQAQYQLDSLYHLLKAVGENARLTPGNIL